MSGPPNLTYGEVPTAGQWNSYFSQKQDNLGYTPVNRAGDTMFGKLNILASSTANAGINLAPGTAPDSPLDGDVWTTNTGLFAQIAGSTIGPIRNGNVAGPEVAIVDNLASFADTSGGLIKDSGVSAGSIVLDTREVSAGTGLTGGGPLSSDVTIGLNSASVASLALADSALQPANGLPRYLSRSDAVSAVIAPQVLSISVLQGDLLLDFIRDASGTALQTADGGWWSPLNDAYPEHWAENVTPGTTDMTAACQAAINWCAANGITGRLSQTIYGVTGVQWKNGARFRGSGNWSAVQSNNMVIGTTIFRYIGVGGTNSYVVNISNLDVGVEGTSANQMSNVELCSLTIDGNQLAEYGFYFNRSWSNNRFEYLTASNTVKHGFWVGNCWNGTPINWMAYENIGCGISLGVNTFSWSACAVDQSTCIGFFGYYSGRAVGESTWRNQFSDANPNLEYGIGLGSHRGTVLLDAQALQCSGAGIYRGAGTVSPLSLIGGYVEGNGQSTNASRHWDVWYIAGTMTLNDTIKSMHFGLATTGAIKITGTPNTSRLEACLKIESCPILPTIDADHMYYRLIDSDRDPIAITGVSPVTFLSRISNTMNNIPIATITFWVNSGVITVLYQEGPIASLTYNSAGNYTLTLSTTQSNSVWEVQAMVRSSNRYVYFDGQTPTSIIVHLNSISAPTTGADPTASNIALTLKVFPTYS